MKAIENRSHCEEIIWLSLRNDSFKQLRTMQLCYLYLAICLAARYMEIYLTICFIARISMYLSA